MADTRKTSAALTRRTLRRTIAVGGALAVSAALAGCGTIQHPPFLGPPEVPAVGAPAPEAAAPEAPAPGGPPLGTVIMIIRHGEKPDDEGSLPGLDDKGQPDESSLTRVGWDRAHKLVDVFDPAQGPVRPGLARPKMIYAARATDEGAGQRTRETVAPLAQKLGVQPNTTFGKGDEERLVKDVTKQPGPILISWQHGEIPAIAEAFGPITPTPPQEWPDERFDVIWTLTRTAAGWSFAQVPEMVLPGDQPTPITSDSDEGGD